MSLKTNDQLLLDYRKSNKARRARIVAKSGFTTEADYLASLLEPDSTTGSAAAAKLFKRNDPVVEETPTIHNVYILDASGSMHGPKIQNAIIGINDEIRELKKDLTVNYTQTIVDFADSNDIKTTMYKVPISTCGIFHTRDRGMTALNQAVGETLTRLSKDNKKGEKILVKIFTDGGENNSRGQFADPKTLAELIKQCEANDFTVTFVGTSYDVNNVINTLKIDASNTLTHDNTARGVQTAFMASAGATMLYSANVKAKKSVSKNFYSKQTGKLD
jgi:uncharacterized protein YegL